MKRTMWHKKTSEEVARMFYNYNYLSVHLSLSYLKLINKIYDAKNILKAKL